MLGSRLVVGLSVLLLGLSVKATPTQAADTVTPASSEAPDRWELRRLTFSGQVGIQSPGGLVGFDMEYAPVRWLAMGTGAGPTITGATDVGYQVGAWLAPRWVVSSSSALGIDLGASGGPYRTHAFLDEHGSWTRFAFAGWFNVGARYQFMSASGFAFRAFLGVATLLNPASGACGEGSTDEPCTALSLGYGGVTIGYARKSDRGAE